MKRILYFVITSLIILSVFLWITFPDVSALKKTNPEKTSMMKLREAEWTVKGSKRKIFHAWVPYSRISPYLVKAVIIAEDDKFWRHEGFDYEAIQKALEKDIKAGKFKAGGSTISQQLAKNLYLTPGKNPIRKIKEALITWRLEKALSKKRIIELYLNVVEWGDGVFGAEAAARHHFGKSAIELTPLEAARLAVVLPNPRRFIASGDQNYVNKRANVIYNIMVKRGIVIPEFEELSAESSSTTEPAVPESVPKPAGIEEPVKTGTRESEQSTLPATPPPLLPAR
ncbi:MAG: monofunctional biosynthetic peptidoglycan transglycosylase [Nitrospirae bacterium]|nr:monofunctional biosynthetic peptidoglycan transglycosylase [Nitrospirota bacterium]